MVAPQNEEVLGVLDLVGQEQADGLERLLAAIYVVAEEEVVGLGREAAVLEEAEQVIILPVDIAANLRDKVLAKRTETGRGHARGRVRLSGATDLSHLDRSFELEQDGLRDEDLAGLGAEITDLGLEQLDLLAWAAAPHLQEAVDYRVEIDVVLVRHCKVPSNPPSRNDGARR